jgi:hypothetical protein
MARTDRPVLANALKTCWLYGAKLIIAKIDRLEIEIGVLAAQCLDRRIESIKQHRDCHLGATAQRRRRPRQMDVHNRKGPRQNGPRLSTASGSLRSRSKSQNHCATAVLVVEGDVFKAPLPGDHDALLSKYSPCLVGGA